MRQIIIKNIDLMNKEEERILCDKLTLQDIEYSIEEVPTAEVKK